MADAWSILLCVQKRECAPTTSRSMKQAMKRGTIASLNPEYVKSVRKKGEWFKDLRH